MGIFRRALRFICDFIYTMVIVTTFCFFAFTSIGVNLLSISVVVVVAISPAAFQRRNTEGAPFARLP